MFSSCLVTKSCLTLCDPMDCSLPGSSVHGISQSRILEWVALSSSRESSSPRGQTHISCIGRQIRYHFSHKEDQCSVIYSLWKDWNQIGTLFFCLLSDPNSTGRWALGVPVIMLNALLKSAGQMGNSDSELWFSKELLFLLHNVLMSACFSN